MNQKNWEKENQTNQTNQTTQTNQTDQWEQTGQWEQTDWTPEEEMIRDRLQELADIMDPVDEQEIPPLDLSFLDKEPSHLSQEKEKNKKKSTGRGLKLVAAVCAIFILSSAMAVYINSDQAHATKFKLEKFFREITGKITITGDKENVTDENTISYEIDTMDDIDKAKKFLPELIVPLEIPEKYKLESLKIKKYIEGRFQARYLFRNEENALLSITIITHESEANTEALSQAEQLKLDDRTIYYWFDEISQAQRANVSLADYTIAISGNILKEEIIEIAKNLQ